MAENTIVLGESGFLGGAFAQSVKKHGGIVHGFGSKTLDLTRHGALSALDSIATPETNLLFASAITPDKGSDRASYVTNMRMVENVAAWLETHPVRMCVFVSSDAVYSGVVSGPVTEETALNRFDERAPRTSLYVAAKLAAERYLAALSDETKLPLLLLRTTGLFGPGDTHGAYGPNQFVRTLVRDKKVKLFGDGADVRDHLFVDDAVAYIESLVAKKATGLVNLASGRELSFQAIVDELRAVAPPELADFEIERGPRSVPASQRVFDVSRLRALAPDVAMKPFRDALAETLRSALTSARSTPR